MALHLITVVGANGWETLAPMLRHYEALGIDSFQVGVHLANDQDPVRERVQEITRQFGCGIYGTVVGDYNLVQQEMHIAPRREYPRDWFILADTDEFQRYPMPLADLIADCERNNWDYVHGCFIDRIAAGGQLLPFDPLRPIADQYQWGASLTQTFLQSDPRKITLVHGAILVLRGQHLAPYSAGCPPEICYPQVHHYKWRSSVIPALRERVALLTRHGEYHVRESIKFLEYIGEKEGRFDLTDPALLAAPCDPEYPRWEELKAAALAMPR